MPNIYVSEEDMAYINKRAKELDRTADDLLQCAVAEYLNEDRRRTGDLIKILR